MTGIMSNSALNVKIHGKLKNRLTQDMYVRMTNLKSVPQVAQFLKNETSWGSLLSDIDTENVHRGFLEEILSRGINRDIKELTSFTNISQGAFLKLFSIQCDIENLKVFLRLLYSGHPERFHATENVFGGELDFSGFSEVKSYDEIMDIIEGTIYAVPLHGFMDYDEKWRIFDVESILDIYYNETVFKFAKKYLSHNEYDIVRETYGSEIDLDSIMFIIRAKKNFDFTKEQMYPYMRHKYAHLNDKIISEMLDAKTLDEVYDIIGKTKYASIFEGKPISCERKIEEYLQKLHQKMFRRAGYSIEAVLYYVKIREIEFRNIVTITEGIRYGLEPTDIQRYIIGAQE